MSVETIGSSVYLRIPSSAPESARSAIAWYDNEWGYSNRCVDVLQKVLPVTVAAGAA